MEAEGPGEAVDRIAGILRRYRIRFGTEELMQQDVAAALDAEGIAFAREVSLGAAGRIDFLLSDSAIGIECKVGGGPSAVFQQCVRYAEQPALEGLILVSRRRQHCLANREIRRKPFRSVWIGASGL